MHEIESKNLRYRAFEDCDLAFLVELLTDDEVCKYLPGGKGYPENKIPVVLSHFQLAFKDNKYHKVYIVFEKGSDKPIGYAGVQLVKEFMKYEIFYAYIPYAWGKGYGTEASLRMKEVAIESGLKELIALADINNIGSQRVLEKTGFNKIETIDLWGLTMHYYEMDI